MAAEVRNLVVVSDTHVGCRLGLVPDTGWRQDEGGWYKPSKLQKQLWAYWKEFWDVFVPEATKGEPFIFVMNGDAIDGVHHRSVSQWSHNVEDQRRCAEAIFHPVVQRAERVFWIRGTEAHGGSSAQDEEAVARNLGAVPDENGHFARYDLWIKLAGCLGHFLHHIGTTGSQAYESTALMREITEEYIEAARWNQPIPDFTIRSHRHRHMMISMPTVRGPATVAVTPCWQGKTPFVWKIPGGRLSLPQWGGLVIRRPKGEQLSVIPWVKTPERSRVEG